MCKTVMLTNKSLKEKWVLGDYLAKLIFYTNPGILIEIESLDNFL